MSQKYPFFNCHSITVDWVVDFHEPEVVFRRDMWLRQSPAGGMRVPFYGFLLVFVWLLEGGLRRNLCPMVEWRKKRHSPLQGFITAN